MPYFYANFVKKSPLHFVKPVTHLANFVNKSPLHFVKPVTACFCQPRKAPPYGEDDLLTDKLCGNGCVEFLNTRKIWLANMFGDFSKEAATVNAQDHADAEIVQAAMQKNTDLEDLACLATARADALAADRASAGANAVISHAETHARGTAKLYRQQKVKVTTPSQADAYDVVINSKGVRKLVLKPKPSQSKSEVLTSQRRRCYVVLDCAIGYLVGAWVALAAGMSNWIHDNVVSL